MAVHRPTPDTVLRPDDGDAFRDALRSVRRMVDVPVVFGGPVRSTVLRLSEFAGVRTDGMRDLDVVASAGLGGQVVATRRPGQVRDYGSAESITHDYDKPVLAEGLRAMTAVPVIVRGVVRGVLYSAARHTVDFGDRVTDTMVTASRRLAGELAVRDEVDRRLQLIRTADAARQPSGSAADLESVRELHAEFRSIAQSLPDDVLRDRLRTACARLAALGEQPPTDGPGAALAPRELDVLAQVGLGCTNAEAARRLSVGTETVKAYLRSAMRKLDARTRHEAVVLARRHGLLP